MGFHDAILVLLTNRSGHRISPMLFAAHLQQLFLNRGVVHHVHTCPPSVTAEAFSLHDPSEFAGVAVVGGDGAVHAAAQEMCKSKEWASKPLLIVPAGLRNSVACSAGIFTPALSVTAFQLQRFLKVPVWTLSRAKATIDQYDQSPAQIQWEHLDLCVSSFTVGLFANIVTGAQRLQETNEQFAQLPTMRRRLFLSGAYNVMRNRIFESGGIRLRQRGSDASGGATSLLPVVKFASGDFSFVLASQLPLQARGFALTSMANPEDPSVTSVVVGHASLTRRRLMRLVQQEATTGKLIPDSHVEVFDDVTELVMSLPRPLASQRRGESDIGRGDVISDGEYVQWGTPQEQEQEGWLIRYAPTGVSLQVLSVPGR